MNLISKEYILTVEKAIIEGGCWIIIDGSSSIHYRGKNYPLHRLSAYLWHGGFDLFKPNDATICHKCDNDTTSKFVCFNPEHIYVGSDSSNMIDAVKSKTHVQARKTHCPAGHKYDEVVRRYGKITERRCSICRRNATRKWRGRS